MIKEALLCGLGMVLDLSGSSYARSLPVHAQPKTAISDYWRSVGGFLRTSVDSEHIQVEVAKQRQLQLNLGK